MSAEITVLHVEDDPAFADLTADILGAEDGVAVLTANDASTAGDLLADHDVDCIVSDYDMQGRTGIEFLEAVRADHPDLPFILFTGKGSEEVASEAFSAGATDYLQKEGGTDQFTVLLNRIENYVERARAERERERQLEAIETAQEGISILNADREFVYVNKTYADLYGYEKEDLVGEHCTTLYPESEHSRVEEEILPQLAEEGTWSGLTTGVRADGTTFTEDHSLSVSSSGELICTVRDITDRKRREEDLRRYRTIVESLGEMVYTIDEDGRFTYVNDAYETITGYAPEEVIGEHVSLLLPEESIERSRDVIRTLLSDETEREQQTFEITMETKGGEEIVVEDNLSLLPMPEGEYRGIAGVGRDITDSKERERELAQYKRMVNAVSDMVYILDEDERFVFVNDTAAEMTGYDRDELLGKQARYIMAEEADLERGRDIVRQLLREGDESAALEWTLERADGTTVPCETHLAPLRDDDGTLQGTAGVVRDVSGRRERELELQRQNDRLEEFVSIVSHDLQTPLSVAQTRADLARADRDDEHLAAIDEALSRMADIIDSTLALARQGETVAEPEPVPVHELAEECWSLIDAPAATVEVRDEFRVSGDPERLRHVFENLFRNAVEHGSTSPRSQAPEDAVEHGSTSPASHARQDAVEHGSTSPASQARQDAVEHGSTGPRSQAPEDAVEHGSQTTRTADGGVTITVDTLPDGDGFYVADDGPGIPEDDRPDVFESGYTTAEDGTGFGLAIVEQIVTAHGWDVSVTDSEDGGARFEVTGVSLATNQRQSA